MNYICLGFLNIGVQELIVIFVLLVIVARIFKFNITRSAGRLLGTVIGGFGSGSTTGETQAATEAKEQLPKAKDLPKAKGVARLCS